MNTKQSLESRLRENPQDWDAWAVYGDLLQSEGDVFGEFIAARLAVYRMKEKVASHPMKKYFFLSVSNHSGVTFGGLDGERLPHGQVYFYEPDGSSFKHTYTDKDLTTVNANPVVLDSYGQAKNLYLLGDYKITVIDQYDACVVELDYIAQQDD